MSDIASLGIEVEHLKDKCGETSLTVGGLEDECNELSDRTHALEMWRNGNGAKGAEVRLQATEAGVATMKTDMVAIKACVEQAISPANIANIAREAAKAVVANARDKDKTTVAKIRAFGPLFTGIAALLTGIAALVAVTWK